MSLCSNCGVAMDRCNAIGRRILNDEAILSIVRKSVAPQTVNETDYICQACWNQASTTLEENRSEVSSMGHRRVCVLCGRSLLRRIRFHFLSTGSERERGIYNVIKEWIIPRTVGTTSVVCKACWMRANRASRHFLSGPSSSAGSSVPVNEPVSHDVPPQEPSVSQQNQPVLLRSPIPTTPTIVLPDYSRPVETESRCFVEGCRRRERNRVTLSMRRQLLKMYKYYVPPNNRLCDFHLTCTSWDFLNEITDNIINRFTSNHIQDMLSLKD